MQCFIRHILTHPTAMKLSPGLWWRELVNTVSEISTQNNDNPDCIMGPLKKIPICVSPISISPLPPPSISYPKESSHGIYSRIQDSYFGEYYFDLRNTTEKAPCYTLVEIFIRNSKLSIKSHTKSLSTVLTTQGCSTTTKQFPLLNNHFWTPNVHQPLSCALVRTARNRGILTVRGLQSHGGVARVQKLFPI